MKYAVLATALMVGLPVMAGAAMWFARVRSYLFSAMIFATVLGAHGSMNLVSRELYRGPDRGFEITATDLACWALIIALIVRFYRKIDWFPRNSAWLLLFFLYACALTAASPERLFAAFSLWKCVRIYLLYSCTVNCLRVGIHRRYVWLGLAGPAALLTAMAVQQKYLYGLYRIHGPFDHSNTVPLYANLILPVLLIWALCDPELGWTRSVISLALSLGLLFTVLCTFSRAGLALAVACVIAALAWANMRSRAMRTWAGSGVLLLVLAAGSFRAIAPIIARIQSAPKESVEARDEFNYSAQLILRDHPFGIGLNNFSYVVTTEPQYREHFQAMRNEEQVGVCHHIYWLTAAETGYPGLLLYLVVMLRFIWIALGGAWRRKTVEGTLLFGVFLGLCALQASGFYEWVFRQTPVMQLSVISAAIAVAWRQVPRRARASSPDPASVGQRKPAPLIHTEALP